MSSMTRRRFLRDSAAGVAALTVGASHPASLSAAPLRLPIGVQLWTLRKECEKDLEGTLEKIAAIGYEEVEVHSGLLQKGAAMRRMLSAQGLKCSSTHFPTSALRSGWELQIEYAQQMDVRYMVCPAIAEADRKSLDTYLHVADALNRFGEKCHRAGIRLAYHNHNFEFKSFGGVVAYDELLRRTDPRWVYMELDCFWITFAGRDPVDYFRRYPGRFALLHIKDLKPGHGPTTETGYVPNPFTEVGRGRIDWKRIFGAAREAGVELYFVEQDRGDRPPLESVEISYNYLKNMDV